MNFIDYFSGYWITKKSVFIYKNKKKYSYEEQIKIIKNDSFNDTYVYKLAYNLYRQNNYYNVFNLSYNNNLLHKNNNIIAYKYKIKKINKYLLKININLDNNLTYYEYIHSINKNFNTSISFIKKNKNYLVTIFTSYIRICN